MTAKREAKNEIIQGIFNSLGTTTPVHETTAEDIIRELREKSFAYKFFSHSDIAGNYNIVTREKAPSYQWVAEGEAPTEVEPPEYGGKELTQKRVYTEAVISQQLINSSNIGDTLVEDLSDTLYDAVEEAIFNGDGVKMPKGIIPNLVKTVIETDNDIETSLVDLRRALKQKYRNGAVLFLHPDTCMHIHSLRDAAGKTLYTELFDALGFEVQETDSIKSYKVASPGECIGVYAAAKGYHTNTQPGKIDLTPYNDSAYKRKGQQYYGVDLYMDGAIAGKDRVIGLIKG